MHCNSTGSTYCLCCNTQSLIGQAQESKGFDVQLSLLAFGSSIRNVSAYCRAVTFWKSCTIISQRRAMLRQMFSWSTSGAAAVNYQHKQAFSSSDLANVDITVSCPFLIVVCKPCYSTGLVTVCLKLFAIWLVCYKVSLQILHLAGYAHTVAASDYYYYFTLLIRYFTRYPSIMFSHSGMYAALFWPVIVLW